jgi:hypothetical protein
MSDWGFVFTGWIITYLTLGIWFYTSSIKKTDK